MNHWMGFCKLAMVKRNNNLIHKHWGVRVIIALALVSVLVRACYYHEVTGSSRYAVSQVIGKTLMMRGKPLEIIGANSFTLSDRQSNGSVPILVVNASAEPFDFPSDGATEILVTGLVRNLVISEVEQEFHLRLSAEDYKNYINKPAIIAKSILFAPTISQITSNPSKYYGKKLATIGKVINIQSPVLFTLNDEQWFGVAYLPVLLNAMPKMAINQGQTIEVIGVVRPFVVGEIERDYKTTWSLRVKSQLNAKYGNKPVFVAESVYSTPI